MQVFKIKILISLFVVVTFAFIFDVRASLIHVDASVHKGKNNGVSWENAYSELQIALDRARKGDSILLAQGIYYPAPFNGKRETSFLIGEHIILIGGYKKGGSERNTGLYTTILSGDIQRDDQLTAGNSLMNIENNSYHVIVCEDGDGVVIDGITIT